MSPTAIHQTAVIHEGAKIDPSVIIEPYAVIGPNVEIKAGTRVGSHAVIDGHTVIGADCKIFPGVTIGLAPQDLSYKDEPTGVIIGDRVTLREYVTVHRATGDRTTVIGDECFLMAYSHVAHDCKLGKGVIMANNSTLAGHVQVGDGAVFAGMVVIHQHVRIGRLSMISGMSGTRVDLAPFGMYDGRPVYFKGLNVIGMRRGKIGQDVRTAIKSAYKLIYDPGLNASQALQKIETELPQFDEVKEIVDFVRGSKRGIAKSAFKSDEDLTETDSL